MFSRVGKLTVSVLELSSADTLDVSGFHLGSILPNFLVKSSSGPHETLRGLNQILYIEKYFL